MSFSKKTKKMLLGLIQDIEENKEQFVVSPGKDFTRNRKISMAQVISFLISMGNTSLRRELMDFWDFRSDAPTLSAIQQQRTKIKEDAFYQLIYRMNDAVDESKKTFHGYQLIAIDGSSIPLPSNTDDPDYLATRKNRHQRDYYQMYLHAAYDLLNRVYVDLIMTPRKKHNEHDAADGLLDRGHFSKKTIFIADRGYEGYKLMAHMEASGVNYLLRVKDGNSGGILKGLVKPEDKEFDRSYNFVLTYKDTKRASSKLKRFKEKRLKLKNFKKKHVKMKKYEIKRYRRVHKYLASYYFTEERSEYRIRFRVVRVKLSDGNYECLLTNLPAMTFPPETLKKLYWMRWGIETSFRELKYMTGLSELHARKVGLIRQELLVRVILYNFNSAIIGNVIVTQKDRKYDYAINRSVAFRVCWEFLKSKGQMDVEALISRELTPYRPDKILGKRKRTYHPSRSFMYRSF